VTAPNLFFSFFLFFLGGGQRPLVPLLLLGLPFFPISIFLSTTLLTGMTSISLHVQWPLNSQSHGSFLKKNNCFLMLWIKLHTQQRQIISEAFTLRFENECFDAMM
jgi:hypothetical protein